MEDFLELKELLDAKFTGIKAEIKAGNDFITYKLDEVINHQKESNGRLCKQEDNTRFARWIELHPKMSIIFFILSIAIIVIVVNITGLKTIIETIIK